MRFTLFIIFCITLSSCYTYKVYPKEYRSLETSSNPIKAHVLNPNLKKEYKILESSGLFELTNLNDADITITLDTFWQSYVCGQPIVVSAMTLGQLPVYMPDRYTFNFTEQKGNDIIEYSLELKVAKRIWFWDLFNPHKGFNPKAGVALRGAYHDAGGGF